MRRGLAVLLILGAAALPAAAGESFVLADLSWMAGRWAGTVDGMTSEETWSAPLGDTMVGTFRLVREGKAVFYELVAIEQEGSGPVMLLRQFERGLTDARPDVLRFPLISLKIREAIFEGPDKNGTARLTYRRVGDELTVLLDKTQAGKTESRTFRFELRR